MMRHALLASMIAACSASAAAPPPPVPARKCLPVVAAACGCVYACGIGVRAGDHWQVTHANWKGSELRAVIAPWCVDGHCTDAFRAEIVCDGICTPKPADASCHFDAAGACVTGTPARP